MIIKKVYASFNVIKLFQGKLALELINDFLEFFKMDYTQSVFSHESNLKDALKRDDLKKELGVRGEGNKPVLFHIISALVSGGGITSPNKENLYNIFFMLSF